MFQWFSKIFSKHHTSILLVLIVSSVVLGISMGYVYPAHTAYLRGTGHNFLVGLKWIVHPLIIISIIHSIASLADLRTLNNIFKNTLLYYFTTTSLAVFVGLVVVNLLQPGKGFMVTNTVVPQLSKPDQGILSMLMQSLFSPTLLSIYYSITIGVLLNIYSKRLSLIKRLITSLHTIMMSAVQKGIWLMPIGIFSLLAVRIGSMGSHEQIWQVFSQLGRFVFAVTLGLGIHSVLIFALLALFCHQKAIGYLKNMITALGTAFATSSSFATIPVTLNCVQTKNSVSPSVSHTVIPLGATINMDGTALYEAMAALFIAQAYNIDLNMGSQILIFLTATLAAIGAAGIPEAGIIMLVMVLNAVQLPIEGISMILVVDWFLDRCRTTVNVWGDSVGAGIVDTYHAKSLS